MMQRHVASLTRLSPIFTTQIGVFDVVADVPIIINSIRLVLNEAVASVKYTNYLVAH